MGVASFRVLPPIPAALSLALVGAALLPAALSLLVRAPGSRMPTALSYALLCGFWFGYHVHEKAILPVSNAPASLAACLCGLYGGQMIDVETNVLLVVMKSKAVLIVCITSYDAAMIFAVRVRVRVFSGAAAAGGACGVPS